MHLPWTLAVFAASLAFEARTATAADSELDLKAVKVVCGRCHTPALFLNQTRSWDRWNDVFADMTQRGAEGTDDELVRVTTFFLENLTLVNVNTAPAEELTGVLGVSNKTADAIIARRQKKPLANLAQLRAIPGVDPATIEKRKSRIQF